MKKISILLILTLFIFAVQCSSPNKPEDNSSKKITLSEREGNYEGSYIGQDLKMKFDNKGQVTAIMFGTLDFNDIGVLPTKVGEPTSTDKEYIFEVKMKEDGKPSSKVTKVKVIFDSDTEATGGKAYLDLTGAGFLKDPIIIKKVA